VTDLGEHVMNLCSAMHGGMELEVGGRLSGAGATAAMVAFFCFL
jgi:hypothetical protein